MSRLITLLLVASFTGCGKGGDDGAPTAAKEPSWQSLASTGLEGLVPGDAKIEDEPSHHTVRIGATHWAAGLTVRSIAHTLAPKTFEEARQEIEKDSMNPLERFTKEARTADGWHFEYESGDAASKDSAESRYGLSIGRTINGEAFQCYATFLPKPADLLEMAAICRSLRAPAKP